MYHVSPLNSWNYLGKVFYLVFHGSPTRANQAISISSPNSVLPQAEVPNLCQ